MVNSIAVYNNLKNKAVIFTCPYQKHPVTGKPGQCNITDKNTLQTEVQKIYDEMVKERPNIGLRDRRSFGTHEGGKTFEYLSSLE